MSIDDPFKLLGLPRSYDIDPSQLRAAYLSHASLHHPDVVEPGDTFLDDTGDISSRINEAKRVLENPEHRANALLMLEGGPGPGEDRTLPDGFLMEMMDIREQIDAGRGSKDSAAIDRWEFWAKEQRNVYTHRVSKLFAEHESTQDPAVLRRIRHELNAWRYIERLLEQIHPEPEDAGT